MAPRRNVPSNPSMETVIFMLQSLQDDVHDGFDGLNRRYEQFDVRLRTLELRQERVESQLDGQIKLIRNPNGGSSSSSTTPAKESGVVSSVLSGDNIAKIILGLLAIIGTILTLVGAGK